MRPSIYSHKPRKICSSIAARLRCAVTTIALLTLSVSVQAQSTASIEGLVTDQRGDVIPDVALTVINPSIGLERAVVTGNAGRYQIAALPVGDYRLEVRAAGFQTQILERVRLVPSGAVRFETDFIDEGRLNTAPR